MILKLSQSICSMAVKRSEYRAMVCRRVESPGLKFRFIQGEKNMLRIVTCARAIRNERVG